MIKDCQPEMIIKDAQQPDKLQWENCVLLIKAGQYRVQVGLYMPDTKYFPRLWSYSFVDSPEPEDLLEVIHDIISENKIEAAKCRKIGFIIDSPLYTVVPEELYKKEQQEAYFDFLYKKADTQIIRTDAVEADSLRLIYAVDKHWKENILQTYPRSSFYHNQTVLLDSLKDADKENAVYITLDEKFISVLAFSENKLQLAQPYRIGNASDVVYHILNVVSQLSFSAEKTALFFIGRHKESDSILKKLEGRFAQVKWIDRPVEFQFPAEADQYPAHYFYHLVSLASCEL